MPHPELRGGWHEIIAHYPAESKGEMRMSIGRFNDDLYHLLGYCSTEMTFYFSSASESNRDIGIVRLPDDKSHLSDLVKGDVFEVHYHEGKVDEAKYVGRR